MKICKIPPVSLERLICIAFLLLLLFWFRDFEIKLRTINQQFIRMKIVYCSNVIMYSFSLDRLHYQSEVNWVNWVKPLNVFIIQIYCFSFFSVNALMNNFSMLTWPISIKWWKIEDFYSFRHLSTQMSVCSSISC